jgi:hypothetical protein
LPLFISAIIFDYEKYGEGFDTIIFCLTDTTEPFRLTERLEHFSKSQIGAIRDFVSFMKKHHPEFGSCEFGGADEALRKLNKLYFEQKKVA